jgi:hypothetical protein
MLKIKELFTTFEKLLKSHDWLFDFADDHSVWTRGHAERERLRSLALTLGKEDAERVSNLWNALCPDGFERSTESFEPKAPKPKKVFLNPLHRATMGEVVKLKNELDISTKEAAFRLKFGVEPSDFEREIGFIFHFKSHPELWELA